MKLNEIMLVNKLSAIELYEVKGIDAFLIEKICTENVENDIIDLFCKLLIMDQLKEKIDNFIYYWEKQEIEKRVKQPISLNFSSIYFNSNNNEFIAIAYGNGDPKRFFDNNILKVI